MKQTTGSTRPLTRLPMRTRVSTRLNQKLRGRRVAVSSSERWRGTSCSVVKDCSQPGRPCSNSAQDSVDYRIEQPGIGHNSEIKNGEDKHSRDRRNIADTAHNECSGFKSEAADERCDNGDRNQRNER